MAIRIEADELLTLAAAAKRLPMKNSGKRPHVAALYRWASVGCAGVVLETIQVGGQRFTSVAALQRFFDELTERSHPPKVRSASVNPMQSTSDVERAEAEVARLLGTARIERESAGPEAAVSDGSRPRRVGVLR